MSRVRGAVWCGWVLALGMLAGCGDGQAKPVGSAAVEAEPPAADVETPGLAEPKTGLLKIAVIPKGTTHEFWKSIHAGAVKAEQELEDVQVTWKGPTKEDDRAEQINVVQNFINAGVDGICIAPLDDTALVKPIREAVAAGIPVMVFDSGVRATVGKDYVSYVSTDNELGGVKGAQRLIEILGGKGKVILLRYQTGSASTMLREKGFMAEIAKHPDIEIISENQYAGATTETAFAKAENLLNLFADVDGIFTPNESSTFGMLRALQTSGRAGKVKFVGFDSSEKLIEAMRKNELHGLVLQDPLRMGYEAVKTMAAHLRGEPVKQRMDTGSAVATPANMKEPRMAELLAPPHQKYVQ